MTPELNAQIQLFRQKAAAGTLTTAEMREALTLLRSARIAAAGTSATSRAKASTARAKKNVNSDDLLDELDSL